MDLILPSSDVDFPESFLGCAANLETPDGRGGSGFYVVTSAVVCLVTAAHVIATHPSVVASSLPADTTESRLHRLTIDLGPNGARCRAGHGDVAVVEVARHVDGRPTPVEGAVQDEPIPKSALNVLTDDSIVRYEETVLGRTMVMVGFPASLGLHRQFEPSIPLLRKGILAGKIVRNKTLILDLPTFRGNSGSPVFEFHQGRYVVAGVMSMYVPHKTDVDGPKDATVAENSGYSVAAAMDEVMSLIDDLS
jgi:V8-like Glu-specific endopeptidase